MTAAFSLLQYVVQVEVFEETVFTHSGCLKEKYFNRYSVIYGFSALILYQSSASGSFLKVSWLPCGT